MFGSLILQHDTVECLDYSILHKILPVTPIEARSYGILGVEIGVAFTVTAIMFAIYANLSSHGRMKGGL